jgi:class 3 adenylate cyclase
MYPGMAMEEEVVAFLATMQRQACGPATAVGFIRLLHEYDVRDVLPTLRLPVLALAPYGLSDDWLFQQAEATTDLIPGGILRPLPATASRLWHPSVITETRAFLGIEQAPPELDRVLATVLFTDIVDSTAQAAAMGDRGWRETRERHDTLVRSQLARYRGREVKTMGDGFLATFDGPARAVRCAQAIAEGVADLGIEVRAGLHTGEIELDGDDVTGIAVAIGARVGAIAQPSEVLVSRTLKDLTAGSGISYTDRGQHELKGVPDRWRLFAAT